MSNRPTFRCRRATVLSAATMLIAFAAWSGETPAPSKPAISFDAGRVTMLSMAKGAPVVLQGGAWLEYDGARFEAEELVFFPEAMHVYAAGDVRLSREASEIVCDEIFYDLKAKSGAASEAKLVLKGPERKGRSPGRIEKGEADLVILRSATVRQTGPDSFKAEAVTITTCDFARPHWKWLARSVEVTPGRRLISRGNTLYIGPVPVMKLPVLSVSLDHLSDYPGLHFSYGHSSQWGYHTLTKIGLDFDVDSAMEAGAPAALDDVAVDLDWRQERGWAWGLSGDYRTALLGRGRGSFETYWLRETNISGDDDADRADRNFDRNTYDPVNGTPIRLYAESQLFAARRAAEGGFTPSFELERHGDDERWGVDVVHRQTIAPGLRLDAEFHEYSDRDYQYEYFEDAFHNDLEQGSFASLVRTGELSVASLTASGRINDFETHTEKLPELRWSVPGLPAPGGVIVSADVSAARLRRRFDDALGIDSHDATRLRGRVELSRPLRLGALSLRPFVGTDQAYYDDNIAEGADIVRGAALYGAEASVKFLGELVKPGEDGTGGLRHVIEPRVRYTGVSDPTHDPTELFDFDEFDDLVMTDVVTFRIDQRLQTKRPLADGSIITTNVAALELSMDYFPTSDGRNDFNSGREWDYLEARLWAKPVQSLTVYAGGDFDVHQEEAVRAETGFRWTPPGDFRLRMDYRLLREDPSRGVLGSEEVSARLEARLNSRWHVRVSGAVEFEENDAVENGAHSWSVGLTRDCHDWEISFSYSVDKNDDDRLTFVNFTPKGYSRNLIRGSTEVLPGGADYSAAGDGATTPSAGW